jgi:streptogramin lyase
MIGKITFCSVGQVLMALVVLASASGHAQLSTINYFPSGATLSGITAGPDGDLWFQGSVNGSDVIGEMTNAGQVVALYPVTYSGSSFNRNGITTGLDGNIWFLDDGTNSVGVACRVQTTICNHVGDVLEYVIKTPRSRPYSIVSGPDGALWFTEIAGNNIGRITTKGKFVPSTGYPVAAGSAPYDIVPGTDGKSLWFTENSGNNIGQISTSGEITVYQIPTANSYPASITIGPDGAVWFTESGVAQVGQLTIGNVCNSATGSMICEYPSPIPQPGEMAVGPDGALWIVEQLGTAGDIGRITTNSEGSLFQATCCQEFIASGVDGALWFTTNFGSIGQAIPSARRNAVDISPCGTNPTCVSQLTSGLPALMAAGVQYAVVEAAKQSKYQQVTYAQLQTLQNAGFGTGAYCFLDFTSPTKSSGHSQATKCLNAIGNLLNSVKFVALDVEDTSSSNQSANIQLIQGALDELTQGGLSAQQEVIYTNSDFWTSITGNYTQYSNHPLWIAGLPESFWGYVDPGGNWFCNKSASSLVPTWHAGVPGGLPELINVNFGGWTTTLGAQYDEGINGGACLFGLKVDFDVFAPALFQSYAFSFTGAVQTWTVPSSVTSITVDVRGAQGGGNPVDPTVMGGNGGRVQTTIAVTPGETLTIYVAGAGGYPTIPNGAGPGGFNGGGAGNIDNVDFNGPSAGGGGASDVRQGGNGLGNRVVVAGGGGGAECCEDASGGAGGGLIGANGGTPSEGGSTGGGGGTQSNGGAAGTGCDGSATPGSLGQGGTGGPGNRAGGGGGGGYYGGGGGGGCTWGSGGGGGSSYSAGTGTVHTQGYQTGNGEVIISY